MKTLLISTAAIALLGATQMSVAVADTCKLVNKSAHFVGRPGKQVVKFTVQEYGHYPEIKVKYRGDLNGETETLRAKMFQNGNLIINGQLPGGDDADSNNNAPGSTYDPNHKYTATENPYLYLYPGDKLKFVFKLKDGDDASWAVVNKVKVTYNCNEN